METLKNCITGHLQIDDKALDAIVASFEKETIKKGEFFLRSGQLCRKMAFIESGYLRMYDVAEGKEITFWIGSHGKFITSLSSFIFQSENFWNIQAVTDCTLYCIDRDKHFDLCKRQPKWLEFDNLLLARSFALLERNMFAQLHTTAQQRFESLLNEEPALFNHIPLQYIAAMLGITPESLSRLRKNHAKPVS